MKFLNILLASPLVTGSRYLSNEQVSLSENFIVKARIRRDQLHESDLKVDVGNPVTYVCPIASGGLATRVVDEASVARLDGSVITTSEALVDGIIRLAGQSEYSPQRIMVADASCPLAIPGVLGLGPGLTHVNKNSYDAKDFVLFRGDDYSMQLLFTHSLSSIRSQIEDKLCNGELETTPALPQFLARNKYSVMGRISLSISRGYISPIPIVFASLHRYIEIPEHAHRELLAAIQVKTGLYARPNQSEEANIILDNCNHATIMKSRDFFIRLPTITVVLGNTRFPIYPGRYLQFPRNLSAKNQCILLVRPQSQAHQLVAGQILLDHIVFAVEGRNTNAPTISFCYS